ncbi:MAG: DNA recombination protein RmuC [Burkholderiaceae bacterium]
MPVVSLTFFVVALFAALAIGALLGAFIARGCGAPAPDPELAQMRERASRVATLEGEAARLSALVDAVRADAAGQREDSATRLSRLSAELAAEREGAVEKLRVLQEAKAALTDQFKSLANDILEEKSKRFAEQNQRHLGALLDPLRIQLNDFKGKVEEVYVQEGKDRSALAEQVRQLMELNQTLSRDANNLTLALKGSAKTQGNWGELILERVLEASGLRKGHEYHVQDSRIDDEGKRLQPDVVLHLPEERRLVVDAKVSLVAYDRFAGAATDDERAAALRLHLDSVRRHLRGLSEKRYQDLYGLKSLDMVVMFVPIEPAFMLAVTNDDKLFMEAWRSDVLLVSPSTLLFVVRTIANLWRQEAQGRNAQEIARRGADLYDKLAAFVADLQKVGAKLKDAQSAYDEAEKKLATGRGNVIRQAVMLKDLGLKTAKALPPALVDASGDDGDGGHCAAPAGAAPPESPGADDSGSTP